MADEHETARQRFGTPLRLSEDTRPEVIRNRNGSLVAEAVSVQTAQSLIEIVNDYVALAAREQTLRQALEKIADRHNTEPAEWIARAALAADAPAPKRATICPECGSGLLDGEHIANYPCSLRDAPAPERERTRTAVQWLSTTYMFAFRSVREAPPA